MDIQPKTRVTWNGVEGEVTLVLAHVLFDNGTHHAIKINELTPTGDNMQQIEIDGPYPSAPRLSDRVLAHTYTFAAGFLLAYLFITR
jgi:hypothetical protein